MIPALLMRTSRSPVQAAANARTEARSSRSSSRTSVSPLIVAATRSPLAGSRTARTTLAPTPASARAVAAPIPLEAPVTTTVRPDRSGRSAAVHVAFDIVRSSPCRPPSGASGCRRDAPRGPRRAVGPGDDVGDHRDEAEVEDPGQQQHREPGLALELPGVEQGADPRDEPGDQAADHGDGADDPETQEGPGERARADVDDIHA